MLSLKKTFKTCSSAQPTSSACRLLDLPSELLAQILDIVACDDYATQVLSPLSLACQQLRRLSQARLFGSINVVLSQRFVRRGETFIGWLLCTPKIRRYVKHISVRAPLESPSGDDTSESIRLIRLLPLLSNLRSLWLHTLSAVTLNVVQALPSLTNPMHLAIADVPLSHRARLPETSQVKLPDLLPSLKNCDSVSVSLIHGLPGNVGRADSMIALKPLLASTKKIRAIQLVDGSEEYFHRRETMPENFTDLLREMAQAIYQSDLEEFHLSVKHFLPLDATKSSKNFWLQQEILGHLKRLSVVGPAPSFQDFFRHAASLSNLVSLRLRCIAVYGQYTQVSETTDSPLLQLSKLRDLELELVNSQINLEFFANRNLRKLSVHSAENMTRRPTEPLIKLERTTKEVASLIKLCPLLQHVEIDVGDMSRLWDGVAISGVDVEPTIYTVLASLARLPRLRKIRLHPPYCSRAEIPNAPYHQPLSDEQAIKIFNYLKAQCPTLQEVAISTDNVFAFEARRANFHAMSWTMHMLGSQTILVTRQALRDYDQRQIWVGERRLTTEIRRHAYLKRYIPDASDAPECAWIFPTFPRIM